MSFITNYNKKEELYKHLAMIKSIKFTFREIDIIVCIIHNRGEKKIASILSISPRTVSTHVYNIMSKIACNSKEQIIDFIENSGKLILIREYYLHLLVTSNFEKQLNNIGNQINHNQFICYYYRNDMLNISNELYQSIQSHLKLANIKLQEIITSDPNPSTPIFALNKISEDNYYQDLLLNLLDIINPPQKEKIIETFNENYKVVENIHNNTIDINTNTSINPNKDKKWQISSNLKKKFITSFIGISFILLVGITLVINNNKEVIINNPQTLETSKITKNFEEFLSLIKDEQFTSDSSSPEQIQKNHSLVKKIEKILEYSSIEEVQNYLQRAEMPSDILTNYLYYIQALATYYMYNMHDGEKSAQILLYGKKLAEKYVNIRGNIKGDFNKLNNEEIFSELQIITDLPQIYTRIIYSLGRTYFYKSTPLAQARKYFKLAKYLGSKLNLFEGYLSDTNGLLVIKYDLAKNYLKEGNIVLATNELHNILNAYITITQHSDKSYIFNYKPGLLVQETIIPNDPYTLVIRIIRIISIYNKLIKISKNTKEIQDYIVSINKYLQGNKEEKLESLSQILDKVPQKKAADLYNKLGILLLNLWKLKTIQKFDIDDSNIQKTLSTTLSIKNDNNDNLKLAEALFTLARNKSRSSDYTKVEAYRGLIKTYQLMLNYTPNISSFQINELKNKIDNLSTKIKLSNDKSKI